MNTQNDVIFGVSIPTITKENALARVREAVSREKHTVVVTPNPEILLQAKTDSVLRNALNEADIKLPDGIGILFARNYISKLNSTSWPLAFISSAVKTFAASFDSSLGESIKGRIFIDEILVGLKECTVMLVGGSSTLKAAAKLQKKYPAISFLPYVGPMLDVQGQPISPQESVHEEEIVKALQKEKPTILFIGFGAPKQEKWIMRMKEQLVSVPVVMVVGGSFDVISGELKPPPSVLESQEWLWRVIQEPRRIGRIIRAVILFPLAVLDTNRPNP